MFLQETLSLQVICCNSDEKLFCVNSLSINLSDQREVILIYKQISTSSWFRLRKPVYFMLHLNFVMKRKHKSIKTETWIYLLFGFSASPETKQNKMDILMELLLLYLLHSILKYFRLNHRTWCLWVFHQDKK